MGDIQEDDGGTEGKASAQLQQPKSRSPAEGLLSRTRIPAKPLGCSVVWDTDNLQKTRGAQTPEMPQTAASQVTGAKRTDNASASCTQHAARFDPSSLGRAYARSRRCAPVAAIVWSQSQTLQTTANDSHVR